MKRPMVAPAQRNGQFIADPAAEGVRLSKKKLVRGPPPADQARLCRYEPGGMRDRPHGVAQVSPWRGALHRDCRFPSAVFGPVLAGLFRSPVN
jgi:hypothetical protein